MGTDRTDDTLRLRETLASIAPGTPLRDVWDEQYRRAGLPPPRVTLETGSVMMIRQILIETDRLTGW